MNRLFRLVRLAVAIAAVVAVVLFLRHADGARLWAMVSARGPVMVLALLPFLAAMAVDTAGWGIILARLKTPVRYRSLLRIRLATEGAMLSLPGGSIAAEVLRPVLLERMQAVPVTAGAASVVSRKALVVLANSIYLGLGLLAGAGLVRTAVPQAATALVSAAFAGAVICLVLGMGAVLALRGGPWWKRRTPRLSATAELAAAFFRGPPHGPVICFVLFLIVWIIEAAETFVIARLLGLPLTVGGALGFESLISLGRAVGFFLPAGIGIQDVGHLLLARALGVADADAAGAALICIKRTKEVFWIVVGALLLSGTRKRGDGPG
jgi:hypothetical protein